MSHAMMTSTTTAIMLPFARFRRLRRSEGLRRLVRETALSSSDFVYPLFVVHGRDVREEIPSLPGQYHLSPDRLAAEAEELRSLGVPAVHTVQELVAAIREHGSILERRLSDGTVRR